MSSFPLRYGPFCGPFFGLLGLGARFSGIEVGGETIAVRMGWAFRGRAPRSSVRGALPARNVAVSRGVHGWRGTWLVNGAGDGIVEIRFAPPLRARTMGIPLRVRRLRVAVAVPAALIAALG